MKGGGRLLRRVRRLANAALIALVFSSVTVAASAPASDASTPVRGGVLRVAWVDGGSGEDGQAFSATDNFDPTGEYLSEASAVLETEVETLVGYEHAAGVAGNRLVPDLAQALPAPTNGGRTYTFHLKPHIRFGPPVNSEITSRDFVTALERLADPSNGGQYAFYYTVIKGWDAFAAGRARTISGISTPNARTLVFTLTRPTGDFLYRMSLHATAPQPEKVVRCFTGKPGAYGFDLISTGPYMLKGIEHLDVSSCAALKPDTQGYNGTTTYDVVRNPNWNPKIDPYAKDFPDEIVWTIDPSVSDIYDRIETGQVDLSVGTTIPEAVFKHYDSTAILRQRIHTNDGDDTWYLSMNLTQPPFDDVHVRRAMNWVMDKAALLNAWGGLGIGSIANQIVPDTLFDDQLASYAPYGTPGNTGSLAKAKAAMAGSRYDTAHDGLCDARACKHVLLLWDASMPSAARLLGVVVKDAGEIGITFAPRSVDNAYQALRTPSDDIPFSDRPGWAKDYADPLTFLEPLFDGRTIAASGTSDYSMVGITASQCAQLHVAGDCKDVPSVDGQLDRCSILAGQPRLSCYERLDRYLMTEVVPWVPYLDVAHTFLTSSNVTHYAYDQFTDMPAYENISLKPTGGPGASRPLVA